MNNTYIAPQLPLDSCVIDQIYFLDELVDATTKLEVYKAKINDSKISSYEDNLVIILKRTPKIISMIKEISPSTHLIGFKLLDSVSGTIVQYTGY